MSHDKMYQEIEGYEDSLYDMFDILDTSTEIRELIRFGGSKKDILEKISEIQKILNDIKVRVDV